MLEAGPTFLKQVAPENPCFSLVHELEGTQPPRCGSCMCGGECETGQGMPCVGMSDKARPSPLADGFLSRVQTPGFGTPSSRCLPP